MCSCPHCNENPIYVLFYWELHSLSHNFHIHVPVSDFYIFTVSSTYFTAAELADWSWKYINLSQIYECRNWKPEHYNSVLEITVSFLGIHKQEPDIYIGFSSALHLQCRRFCDFSSRQDCGPHRIVMGNKWKHHWTAEVGIDTCK
jgi:hypothetical protein